MFVDGVCLKCGRKCGNGGDGPLRCRCGWVQSAEDAAKAQAIVDKLFEEEFPDDAE